MKKPIEALPATTTGWILEALSFITVVATVTALTISYNELPDVIPQHYNFDGQPDAYGPKSLLFLLIIVPVFLYGVLTVALKYPQIVNYPVVITPANARRQYQNMRTMLRTVKLIIALTCCYITVATIRISHGTMQGLGAWFAPLIISALLGTIALFLFYGYKLR